jgi:hypothetical protein
MPDQDKPAPISLNLDKIEHEGAPGPFVIVLGGERYEFTDAQEIDWQKLMAAMRNPVTFIRLTLPKDKATTFLSTTIPLYKMNRLMEAYQAHFGLVEPGE